MTGQPAYTDADVQAAKQPILDNFHPPSDRISSWHIRPEEMARAVLDAVAPAIAARALRDAAERASVALSNEVGGHTSTYSVRRWLRERADEIEAP